MNRSSFVQAMFAVAAILPLGGSVANGAKQIAGVAIPDTRLAQEATELARSVEPIEIFNHSLRTFLFAELIAKATQVKHDAEIVYVASILHDTGLAAAHMSDKNPFEVDGANLARNLFAKHGAPDTHINLAWDAIALHDNGGIAQHKQAEVKLVNSGVGADFGAYLDILTRDDIVSVLRAAPRTGFIEVFVEAAAVVAKRKPYASAHSFVADVGYRKVPGFQLPNFLDGVRDDPFAAYH